MPPLYKKERDERPSHFLNGTIIFNSLHFRKKNAHFRALRSCTMRLCTIQCDAHTRMRNLVLLGALPMQVATNREDAYLRKLSVCPMMGVIRRTGVHRCGGALIIISIHEVEQGLLWMSIPHVHTPHAWTHGINTQCAILSWQHFSLDTSPAASPVF